MRQQATAVLRWLAEVGPLYLDSRVWLLQDQPSMAAKHAGRRGAATSGGSAAVAGGGRVRPSAIARRRLPGRGDECRPNPRRKRPGRGGEVRNHQWIWLLRVPSAVVASRNRTSRCTQANYAARRKRPGRGREAGRCLGWRWQGSDPVHARSGRPAAAAVICQSPARHWGPCQGCLKDL